MEQFSEGMAHLRSVGKFKTRHTPAVVVVRFKSPKNPALERYPLLGTRQDNVQYDRENHMNVSYSIARSGIGWPTQSRSAHDCVAIVDGEPLSCYKLSTAE